MNDIEENNLEGKNKKLKKSLIFYLCYLINMVMILKSI